MLPTGPVVAFWLAVLLSVVVVVVSSGGTKPSDAVGVVLAVVVSPPKAFGYRA